jgi:hypothetical protein
VDLPIDSRPFAKGQPPPEQAGSRPPHF